MIGQGENDPIGINWEHQTFASSASSDTSLCLYNFRYKCVPFVYVNRGTSRMRILGSTLENVSGSLRGLLWERQTEGSQRDYPVLLFFTMSGCHVSVNCALCLGTNSGSKQ